jgi:hypothetical protein
MNKRDFSKLERSRGPCRPEVASGRRRGDRREPHDVRPDGTRGFMAPLTVPGDRDSLVSPMWIVRWALSALRAACASSPKIRATARSRSTAARAAGMEDVREVAAACVGGTADKRAARERAPAADRRSLAQPRRGRTHRRSRVQPGGEYHYIRLRRADPRGSAAERRGAGIRVRAPDGSLKPNSAVRPEPLFRRGRNRGCGGTSPGDSTAVPSDFGPGHGREPAGASPDGATPPCVVTAAMAITAAKTMATTSQRVQRLLGREQ